MPSPDVRKYYDLTLFDEDSQTIFNNSLSYARVALPDFRPREGSVELVLMQAMAVEVASLAKAINRLPSGVVQVLLELFGLVREEAALPTAVIRINAVNDEDYSFPAGIRVFYQPPGEGDPLIMVTDQVVAVTHSKNVSSISVTSQVATVTTSVRHGFSDSQTIAIAGVASPNNDLNGSFTITVVDDTSFTYAATGVSDVSLDFAGSVSATPPASHPSSGFVAATGTTATEEFNGLSAGTPLDLLTSLPRVASVSIFEAVTGGAVAEPDADYFSRAVAQFARMSQTLNNSNGYEQWALGNSDFPYIYRAKAVDGYSYNMATQTDGSVVLVVAPIDASDSNLLSGKGVAAVLTDSSSADWGQKDEVRLAAQELSHASLTVSVVDPHLVSVAVTATVKPATGVSGATMATVAAEALSSFLSPNSWDWDTTIRKNEIIGLLSQIQSEDGESLVDYVSDLTLSVSGVVPQEFRSVNTVGSTSRVGNDLTINSSTDHDLQASDTNYVALRETSGDWTVFPVSSITDNDTFVVTDETQTFTPVEWFLIASVDTNGDMTINDIAPLVISGNHEVTSI